MKVSKTVILAALFFQSLAVSGQDVVKEYFSKYDFKVSPEKSYYYKVGKKIVLPDGEKARRLDTIFVDSVKTYYTKSNMLRSRLFYIDGFPEGAYATYHENGQLKEKGSFEEGRKSSREISWHSNGERHKELTYSVIDFRSVYKIVNYWDSLGNQLVNNGEGSCRCFLSDTGIREDGMVVEGERDGTWNAYRNDTLTYREEFSDGEFKSGIQYHEGKEYPYTVIEQLGEFPGGIPNMMKYLQKHIKYPAQAKRRKLGGRVYVKFIIEKDGSINQTEVLKGADSLLNDEALRVVRAMPRWTPGKLRGVPVRSQFVLPIVFSLGL